MLLKKCLLAFGLTTLSGLPFILLPFHPSGYWILFFFIDIIYYAFPNVLFLIILYYLNIGKEFLTKIKYMILEILLLQGISSAIYKIVDLLPYRYRFYHPAPRVGQGFQVVEAQRIYLDERFQLLCTYIILFFLLLIIKKIFIKGNFWVKSGDKVG
jgi:hypothetical protein